MNKKIKKILEDIRNKEKTSNEETKESIINHMTKLKYQKK